jgi:hypothetical protein
MIGCPAAPSQGKPWMPAFAGMTGGYRQRVDRPWVNHSCAGYDLAPPPREVAVAAPTAQFPTDCTALNGTVNAPRSNCMPLARLCTPVAVPVTVNGSVDVEPLALPDTIAAL